MKNSYSFACTLEKLKDIRSFMAGSIEMVDLTTLQQHQLMLAVDEICANAIIHGNKSDERKTLFIDVINTDKQVKIEIYDIGKEDFDKVAGKNTSMADIIKSRQKGGMGLKLVRKIVDSIEYKKRGSVHVCILTKDLA